MASVTKDKADMADDEQLTGGDADDARNARNERDDDERDEREEARQKGQAPKPLEYRPAEAGGGFFHIYKSGQGYWTRMGTAAGALLIILLTANFFYSQLPVWSTYLHDHRAVLLSVVGILVVAMAIGCWYLMNKSSNADFLIATDSEMKKVNWTSRTELIGSTKVVIFFVVVITLLLFVIDLFFGYFFYFLGILKAKPF